MERGDYYMERYILNIKTGAIHSEDEPCALCKRMNEGNKKFFEKYEDAVNFYEGKTSKGKPCGICMKEKNL